MRYPPLGADTMPLSPERMAMRGMAADGIDDAFVAGSPARVADEREHHRD